MDANEGFRDRNTQANLDSDGHRLLDEFTHNIDPHPIGYRDPLADHPPHAHPNADANGNHGAADGCAANGNRNPGDPHLYSGIPHQYPRAANGNTNPYTNTHTH